MFRNHVDNASGEGLSRRLSSRTRALRLFFSRVVKRESFTCFPPRRFLIIVSVSVRRVCVTVSYSNGLGVRVEIDRVG